MHIQFSNCLQIRIAWLVFDGIFSFQRYLRLLCLMYQTMSYDPKIYNNNGCRCCRLPKQ